VPGNEIVCVSGRGAYPSKGMILGEAPGADESLLGVPFVGSAGKLLEQSLEQAGTSRLHLFVTNTVKCRPPNNRSPTELEEQRCRQFLLRELQVVQPTHILALGNHALRATTGLWGITKFAGIWHSVRRPNNQPLLVLPCYHPAYVLRQRELLSRFHQIVEDFVRTIHEA
jgi:uracil-DNA glycosylase family 4